MRAVTRIVVYGVAMALAIQYYCSSYGPFPGQVGQLCKYTNPGRYTPVINEMFPDLKTWYDQRVGKHVELVKVEVPRQMRPVMQKYRRYSEKYLTPTVRRGKEFGSLVIARAQESGNVAVSKVIFKARVYHAYVLSQLQRLWYFIVSRYDILSVEFQNLMDSWGYSGNANVDVNHDAAEERLVSTKTSDLANSTNLGDEILGNGFEADEETVYVTSTITATVTLEEELATMKTPESEDLNISLKDMVQEEFQAWQQAIERKANDAISAFTDEVNDYEAEQLTSVTPVFKHILADIAMKSKDYFRKINRAIQEINCTMEIDPETNETIWFDQKGTQLKEYITRPLMRQLFTEANDVLSNITDTIRANLRDVVDTVNNEVDVIREEHLEVYEEWGDVMISEWSKRMAYIDVIDHETESADERMSNWKQFLKLKKRVIKTRDILMEHPVKFVELEKFLTEIQTTLRFITQENSEYLYILRSKANIAFQEREKRDRAGEKREQEELQTALKQKLATEVTVDGIIVLDNYTSEHSVHKSTIDLRRSKTASSPDILAVDYNETISETLVNPQTVEA
ncbi:uncharacterized protein Ecym_2576 [Eremothecium cymbalariae DBVPG|uniref:Outer spore wall assembly protein SHE10 n=1 Tax=Eremothecium cymbalariae (strain CBS 270.75 / DBVPG 7215 / KCTC 17166 / NRRL Y-17582) TaxID=931890 RepID=G8JQF9_ERECY|nr:Hypothetical protein Ecym_2576 [Eremothecium cymbalariae DBVPG\